MTANAIVFREATAADLPDISITIAAGRCWPATPSMGM